MIWRQNLFKEELLFDLLHLKDISRVEKLLFVLACDVSNIKATKNVKELAMSGGLRDVNKWNLSTILGRDAIGYVVNTGKGWLLNNKGKSRVKKLLSKFTDDNVDVGTEKFTLSNLLHPIITENAY